MSHCGTCKFFRPKRGDTDVGECARNAPRLSATGEAAWPLTGVEFVCGDYEEQPAPKTRSLHGGTVIESASTSFGVALEHLDDLMESVRNDGDVDDSYVNGLAAARSILVTRVVREQRMVMVPVPEDGEIAGTFPNREWFTEHETFRRLWGLLRNWQINTGNGQSGATGTHVAMILSALVTAPSEEEPSR